MDLYFVFVFTRYSDFETNVCVLKNHHADTMGKRKPLNGFSEEMKMGDALGLIETKGLVACIEAADAMCKAANVELSG